MKHDYVLLEDHPPFKKGDLLDVTHRTTLYTPHLEKFDHPTENKIVSIPKEKLMRLE